VGISEKLKNGSIIIIIKRKIIPEELNGSSDD
jgi:hypothetical protein